ncbi:hypothetical protein [Allorhodopirellula heiligendammensis]|uniref:Uncharacterized protein n=1 Tax=Allorhodopirellula heiligendammensis TaxID=2714739 RepID=A0A5C6BTN9_9BACT|nr:hypothetical protein [Allorhodopirellula heiligendammensis]TWU15388.1 hypothetical protein Poly21_25830 [Allorhodopirellula heiligendammensis]
MKMRDMFLITMLLGNLVFVGLAPGQTGANAISAQIVASRSSFDALRVDAVDGRSPIRVVTVLSFFNAERVGENAPVVDGLLAFCIDEGRPVAAVNIYPWDGNVCHELDVLSRQANLRLSYDTGVQWQPAESAAVFHQIEGTDPPSPNPAVRLRQIKHFASLFSATLVGFNSDDSDRQELRRMPTPLYRYQVPSPEKARGVVDGAVFAFVQGNDPEVLLLIEAIRDNQTMHWEYAFVRASSGSLTGSYRGTVTWRAEKFPPDSNPIGSHFTVRQPFGK